MNKKLTLFVSYDLTNSTEFKYLTREWPEIYQFAFRHISRGISRNKQWNFWKMNGDELLFYCNDIRMNNIDTIIIQVGQNIKRCIDQLYKKFNNCQQIRQLSLKATMWVAPTRECCSTCDTDTDGYDLRMTFENRTEFIGKEIDVGFRISKYTPRSKVGLSAALLYYLINKKANILKNVRIAGYEQMKGVWGNKRYPIIWYFRKPNAIVESFHYDERYDKEMLVDEFLSGLDRKMKYGAVRKKEFNNVLDYLGIRSTYDDWFGFRGRHNQ